MTTLITMTTAHAEMMHGVFNKMPHINCKEARADLTKYVEEGLDVIRSHGLEEHVGLFRTHKHFDITENEQVVMKYDIDEIDKVVERVSVEAANHARIPYMWCLEDGIWMPVQWVDDVKGLYKDGLQAVLLKIKDFGQDLKNTLNRLGAQNQLGICLRRSIKKMMESTNETDRVQTFYVVTENEESNDKVIDTHWMAQGTNPSNKCLWAGGDGGTHVNPSQGGIIVVGQCRDDPYIDAHVG